MSDTEDPRRRRRIPKNLDDTDVANNSDSEESVIEDDEIVSESEDEEEQQQQKEIQPITEKLKDTKITTTKSTTQQRPTQQRYIKKGGDKDVITEKVKEKVNDKEKEKTETDADADADADAASDDETSDKESDGTKTKSDTEKEEEEENKIDRTNPQFVPTKGQFYLHDDRTSTSYRGRGRGGRGGARGGKQREARDVWTPVEQPWGHDGYEALIREEEEREAMRPGRIEREKDSSRGGRGGERGRGAGERGRGRGRGRGGPTNGPAYRAVGATTAATTSTTTPAKSSTSESFKSSSSTSASTAASASTSTSSSSTISTTPSLPSNGPMKHASSTQKSMNPFAKEFIGNTRIPIAPANRVIHEPKPPILTAMAPVFQPRQVSSGIATTNGGLSIHAAEFESNQRIPLQPQPQQQPHQSPQHQSQHQASPLSPMPLPSPATTQLDAAYLQSMYPTPTHLQYTPAQIQAYLQQTQYGQTVDMSQEEAAYHAAHGMYIPDQHDASLNHPHASPTSSTPYSQHPHPHPMSPSFPPTHFDSNPAHQQRASSPPSTYYGANTNYLPPQQQQQQQQAQPFTNQYQAYTATQTTNPYQFNNITATRTQFYPQQQQNGQTQPQ